MIIKEEDAARMESLLSNLQVDAIDEVDDRTMPEYKIVTSAQRRAIKEAHVQA